MYYKSLWTNNLDKSYAVAVMKQVKMVEVSRDPRQVVYSYLKIKELLKVATLSKKERETVLNSKIVKEKKFYLCST